MFKRILLQVSSVALFGLALCAISPVQASLLQDLGVSKKVSQILHAQGANVLGNAKAKVVVGEFFDYECSSCRGVAGEVAKLPQRFPQVRLVLLDDPALSEESIQAALASWAADQQHHYLGMHEALLGARIPISSIEIQHAANSLHLNADQLLRDMHSKKVVGHVKQTQALGDAFGVEGVPTFVVIPVAHPSDFKVIAGADVGGVEAAIKQFS